MTRRLLSVWVCLLALVGQAWADDGENYLYCPDITASQGSEVTLPIYLHNDTKIKSVQFNFVLPDGVEVKAKSMVASSRAATFTCSFNKKRDGSYIFTMLDMQTALDVEPGDGVLAEMTLTVSEDVAVGEYSIEFLEGASATVLGTSTFDEIYPEKRSSKLTITEYVGPSLYETATTAPEATSEAETWTVYRSLTGGVWNTLCLPFAMTGDQLKSAFGDDVQLADFKGCTSGDETDDEGYTKHIDVNFSSVSIADGLEANHPCLIKTASNVSSFVVEGVKLEPEEDPTVQIGQKKSERCYMIGTYVAETTVPEECLFLSNNKFYYSKGSTKMKAFRAYFELNDVVGAYYSDASSARVGFVVDGETTQIADYPTAADQNSSDAVYSLSGVQVGTRADMGRLAKGIYIVNGKKMTIK